MLIQPKTRNNPSVQRLSAAGVLGWRVAARFALSACAATALVGLTVASAILAKEARSAHPLAAIETIEIGTESLDEAETVATSPQDRATDSTLTGGESFEISNVSATLPASDPALEAAPANQAGKKIYPAGTKFFDGRPVRVAKTIDMIVTAYSPDARSCAGSDDDLTATLHHVTTNGFKLVAADPRILSYGSMLSIPGYDAGRIVPVLDCGGKIKGNRLDVLFPTHEEARKWGVKKIKVTVYEYADGKPKTNPRKVR
ncbi:MAG TPA: 3D domain-containing protein [Phycisphaerales bacterium]